MTLLLNENPKMFSEYGYAVFRNCFERDTILRWRQTFDLYRGHNGDLLSHPGLSGVVFHPRVLSVLDACGIATPAYWLESTAHVGGAVGFHRDNADREDPEAPDWSDDYRIVRVGIYLQNHKVYSGGFQCQAGSHKSARATGEIHYVGTEEGDVVVWDLRILHGGYGGQHLPSENVERRSLFLTYGIPNRHTDRHRLQISTRAYQQQMWKASYIEPALQDIAESHGLKLLLPEIQHLEGPFAGKYEQWHPIPY